MISGQGGWVVGLALLLLTGRVFPAGTDWLSKIDALVRQAATQGETEVLVVLAEKADVRGAASLGRKQDKGAHVFQCLSTTAERSQAELRQFLESGGHAYRPFWIVNMIWVRGDAELIESLARRDDVLRILHNSSVRFQSPQGGGDGPALSAFGPQPAIAWNITKVRAPLVWSQGVTGQGVVIGGQDTGYAWSHPALVGQYRGWDGTNANHNYNWHDAIHTNDVHHSSANPCGYDLSAPCDDDGHGTHTMGIMVGDDGNGNQIGMAPGAKWIGCRNMERGWGTPASYIESFQWFLAPTDLNNQYPDSTRAPDVINNSWTCPPEEGCLDPLLLKSVIETVRAAGIVIVTSAGNDGSTCGTVREAPAIYETVLTAGATDSANDIAGFSGRGPVTVDTSYRLKPDLCAPGVGIRSSVPGGGYALLSGTSMAAPHVAGLVALMISAHPELRGNVDAIEQLIRGTTLTRTTTSQTCGGVPGTEVPNNTFGWGRIDALTALGLGDSDGDGMIDFHEALAGTDMHDPASLLRITGIALTNETALVRFSSVTNKLYDLEVKTTPTDAVWSALATNLPGNGGIIEAPDPAGADSTGRFYRVRLVR